VPPRQRHPVSSLKGEHPLSPKIKVDARDKKGKFAKGYKTTARRAKGQANRITVRIKEALTESLARSGADGKGKDGAIGYFVWLSRKEPSVYGALIGKILPLQLEVADKTNARLTPQQAADRLAERGLPLPYSLNSLVQPRPSTLTLVVNDPEERELDELDDETPPNHDDDNEGDDDE
jgi:hypothetical protein